MYDPLYSYLNAHELNHVPTSEWDATKGFEARGQGRPPARLVRNVYSAPYVSAVAWRISRMFLGRSRTIYPEGVCSKIEASICVSSSGLYVPWNGDLRARYCWKLNRVRTPWLFLDIASALGEISGAFLPRIQFEYFRTDGRRLQRSFFA